jgi:HSP20 family protein
MSHNRRNPLGDIWYEVNRAQEEFSKLFGRLTHYAKPEAAGVGPLVNVWEDDNALHAELDLPDVDPSKLEINVTEGNRLSIQGERKAPEIPGATWIRQERPYGVFTRAIELPYMVDADKVEAAYELGVLRVTLPKSEGAKPRRITVKTGQ